MTIYPVNEPKNDFSSFEKIENISVFVRNWEIGNWKLDHQTIILLAHWHISTLSFHSKLIFNFALSKVTKILNGSKSN